ncbi:MAG: homocysteine S-methyltransferase family protein [Clostridia bacterium]|nr:homocysteine S-methyltransferase family protein [Clostridia bacterium]
MKNIREELKNNRLYFDGGTGTVLQAMGLEPGTPPEQWNLTQPEKIIQLHRAYVEAGSRILKTNTFGVNGDKYPNYAEYIRAAVACAKTAAEGREDVFIAFDMGPTGKLLKPLGDLEFEDAVTLFANNVKVAAELGVDCILIETMNDSYETKAAVLAAKENSDLPVFVTNAYDESGKLMTGADPAAMIAMLEGMGVDALGMNCSFGPDKMLDLLGKFTERASVPIIVNPNAGLPEVVDGKTVYNISVSEFASYMEQMAKLGACVLGGCCGTTPEYIKETVTRTQKVPYVLPEKKEITAVTSYTHAVTVAAAPILIGERINPTGKPRLKEALRSGNYSYILREGQRQADAGAHILDVNVGLPEIDEESVMKQAVLALQAVTDLPLQLDSSDAKVLGTAMRIYNGKALINSVNGEAESMDAVFPLVQKYGGTVIALTMDKGGIPETAEGRVAIAKRIVARAAEFGIGKKDIIVDPLCLTVSSDTGSALVTLEAVRQLRTLGIKTSLGVSNISFGLPKREKINAVFFADALEQGLNCAIMNPFAQGMMDVYYAHCALHGLDAACLNYIGYADSQEAEPIKTTVTEEKDGLKKAVVSGMREDAVQAAKTLLEQKDPIAVIDEEIIPALNEVGVAFEEKRAYLPQLLMSAEAASAAFEEIKRRIPAGAADTGKAVVLATVKGDIHDIGKNIVRVLLESYGFHVYDLGKDVEPEAVCACVKETGCKLVGLSALMTTTVPAMETTIRMLHEMDGEIQVMVGGAVLNPEYAEMIHADSYSPDAMGSVRFTKQYYDGK